MAEKKKGGFFQIALLIAAIFLIVFPDPATTATGLVILATLGGVKLIKG